MSSVIPAPLEWVETVGGLKLPIKADRRLQELMDRNNEGQLTPNERAELEALVEVSETLSLACPGCNLRKSDRLEARDPETGAVAPMFNPRTDRWRDHFQWQGFHVVGVSAVGRATCHALDLNHPRRLRIRGAEQLFALFPPDDP